ncbi:putative diguanylate cyclase [Escherichia coli]|uniref:Putative diguanylate cyclase n=1 Tax=Escherichia coli TaxID=562 RepID=A0A376KK77_ECOLX|nr:putative diguanylate cyclase [Escherichia coli]
MISAWAYAGLRQLQHMKSLPIDVLKIDKMFVEGLPEDSSMIAAIIMLAQSLNLQMIAEGVETEAQRDWAGKSGRWYCPGLPFCSPTSLLKSSKRVTWKKSSYPKLITKL